MTEQEYNALIAILNRAPMTPGEVLWINELLAKLKPSPLAPVVASKEQ